MMIESAIATGMPGGNQAIAWTIEAGGRKRNMGEVVGHAQILKSVGSVLNPKPIVVPVFAGDGLPLGEKGFKCLYYLQNDWSDV
jgi:hypothetical protein